jgi:hypothetical protein
MGDRERIDALEAEVRKLNGKMKNMQDMVIESINYLSVRQQETKSIAEGVAWGNILNGNLGREIEQ